MLHTFKDFDSDSVARLIAPRRLQISMHEMLRDLRFKKTFSSPVQAFAITPAARPVPGELQFVDGRYVLFCHAGALRLRNRQHLLLLFKAGDQEYCAQTQTCTVFANRVELEGVSSRFYQRTPIATPINVWLVPDRLVEAICKGEQTIRRYYQDVHEDQQTFYVIRDRLGPSNDATEALIGYEQITSGSMVELSQGGCSIKLNPLPAQPLKGCKVAYIEATILWGKRVGNLSCFVHLRRIEQNSNEAILGCTFLEALPTLTGSLGDAARDYTLLFGPGRIETQINGRPYHVTSNLNIRLPFGTHVIDARWENGMSVSSVLFLGSLSERMIHIEPLILSASRTQKKA